MSAIWADFPSGQAGIYGTTEAYLTDGVYAQQSSTTLLDDPDPNVTGTVLRFNNLGLLRYALPAGAVASGGSAARIWFDNLPPSDDREVVSFRDVANTAQVTITVDTTGNLRAYRGADTGTLLGATTTPAIVAGAWNHVETKVLISDTVGTVEIRVNGVVKLNLTGQDTKNTANANYAQVRYGSDGASTGQFYIKDTIYWDTAGSVDNDFFGTVSVRDLYPDADISLNWTPSTGSTGWNLIDETDPNDADYIQADDPPPAAYVASLTDLPVDVTSVKALIPIYRAAKTDGGDCNLQIGLTPNNTDWDDGADTPITTAFTYRYDVSELSPDTTAPWTPTEVNSAYVRANRTL